MKVLNRILLLPIFGLFLYIYCSSNILLSQDINSQNFEKSPQHVSDTITFAIKLPPKINSNSKESYHWEIEPGELTRSNSQTVQNTIVQIINAQGNIIYTYKVKKDEERLYYLNTSDNSNSYIQFIRNNKQHTYKLESY